MATLAPIPPWASVKLVIRGATVKLAALVAVPPGVVTLSVPLVALAGTVAVICVLKSTWNAAANPLSLTVTLAPITPLAGAKLVIRGATVKLVALVAVPPGVVTAIGRSWHCWARSS
jgi:hypothetical protein